MCSRAFQGICCYWLFLSLVLPVLLLLLVLLLLFLCPYCRNYSCFVVGVVFCGCRSCGWWCYCLFLLRLPLLLLLLLWWLLLLLLVLLLLAFPLFASLYIVFRWMGFDYCTDVASCTIATPASICLLLCIIDCCVLMLSAALNWNFLFTLLLRFLNLRRVRSLGFALCFLCHCLLAVVVAVVRWCCYPLDLALFHIEVAVVCDW